MKLLIVEDDESVAQFLQQAAIEAGYEGHIVGDGKIALQATRERAYDMILLDVMLPGMDGLTVCRTLRLQGISTPILLLTARDTLQDKIDGLDSGADDYLVKPFELGELLARIRALARRNGTLTPLHVGDLTLDPYTRHATRAGKQISLSATEYTLLELLMRNAGYVLSRAAILEHVWQYNFDGNDNVLDVYISYLRAKIDKNFDRPLIHTVRGVGYRMNVDC